MRGIKENEKVHLKKHLTIYKRIQKPVRVNDHQVKQKHNPRR